MARVRAVSPHFMRSEDISAERAYARRQETPTLQERSFHAGGLPERPLARRSGEVREALGRDGEKASDDKPLRVTAEIPERFATLAKRSGRIAQVLERVPASPIFESDSRGRSFLTESPAGFASGSRWQTKTSVSQFDMLRFDCRDLPQDGLVNAELSRVRRRPRSSLRSRSACAFCGISGSGIAAR